MTLAQNVVRNIYEHLADEASKHVFSQRLLYSLTGDLSYIRQIVERIPEVQQLKAVIQQSRQNILFGAGHYGQMVLSLTPDYWVKVIDNNIKSGGGTAWSRNLLCGRNFQIS